VTPSTSVTKLTRLELALDLRELDPGILDRVMQQAGQDAAGVEPVARENFRDRQRMGDVGVAVVALLPGMGVRRQHVGGVDQRGVSAGVIGANETGEFALTRGEGQGAEHIGHSLTIGRAIRRIGGIRQAMDGVAPSSNHHRSLPPAATAEFRLDRGFEIAQRGVISARHGGSLLIRRDILQAEDVLVGRNEVHDLLVGGLGLGRAGQRPHEVRFQPVEIDPLLGHFAQRHDGVFVIVAIERQLLAARDVAGPLGGQQDQLEAVGNLYDAIFNGDTRHPPNLPVKDE
jgi:hypothetical protein